jgi:hypothetical protein
MVHIKWMKHVPFIGKLRNSSNFTNPMSERIFGKLIVSHLLVMDDRKIPIRRLENAGYFNSLKTEIRLSWI